MDEEVFGTPVTPYTAGETSWDRAQRKKAERATKGGRVTVILVDKKDPFGIKKVPQAQPGGAPIAGNRSRKPAKTRSSRARGKPACKYGPRGPDGFCPKKPARAKTLKATTGKPFKLSRGQSRLASNIGRVAAGTAVGVGSRLIKSGAVKALGKLPVKTLLTAGARAASATAAAVLAAGLISYYVTSKILEARKVKRMKRAEEAALAADGYQQAHYQFQLQQGRAPTATENRLMSAEFKRQLAALGLSTSDLGGL